VSDAYGDHEGTTAGGQRDDDGDKRSWDTSTRHQQAPPEEMVDAFHEPLESTIVVVVV
jgi:hypothetical protein